MQGRDVKSTHRGLFEHHDLSGNCGNERERSAGYDGRRRGVLLPPLRLCTTSKL